MQKLIGIILLSTLMIGCTGSKRGCGCPNNLGMNAFEKEIPLARIDDQFDHNIYTVNALPWQ